MSVYDISMIVEYLLKINQNQGYLTFDNIMDQCDSHNLPLASTDSVLLSLTDLGCKVFDHIPSSADLDISDVRNDSFAASDYAQIDYDKLFRDVLEIDPGLEMIIQYARGIRPAQHGEATYIFNNIDEICNSRNRLFDMNFRHVIRIAYQQYKSCDETLADLIQLGSEGLLKAIDKYDVKSEKIFGSYVNSWIFQSISRGTMFRKNGCYFPAHISEELKEIDKLVNNHVCEKCSGIKCACPNLLDDIQNRFQLTQISAEQMLKYTYDYFSYEELLELNACEEDLPCDDETGGINNFNIESLEMSNDNTIEDCIAQDLHETIYEMLSKLTPREQEIVKYRFGFIDGKEWTLDDVGKIHNITRERVRQIESKIIRKMRHPSRSRILKEFYFN